MTLEELEIIVDASVAKATKEFEKLLPAIKKQLSGIQKEFDSFNLKEIAVQIDTKTVEKKAKEASKKIKEAFNPDKVDFSISGLDEAKNKTKDLSDEQRKLKAEMDKVGRAMMDMNAGSDEYEKLEAKMHALNRAYQGLPELNANNKPITNMAQPESSTPSGEQVTFPNADMSVWDKLKGKVAEVKAYISENVSFSFIDQIKNRVSQAGVAVDKFKASFSKVGSSKEIELLNLKISELKEKMQNVKDGKIKLSSKDIIKAEVELEHLIAKKKELENGGKSSVFSRIASSIKIMGTQLRGSLGGTSKLNGQIEKMGSGFKQGMKNVLRYAAALFSLRGAYSVLSNSARAWLSSQNEGAQQLSANIEYMKYAMGSVFAPVIQTVVNLVYSLMKALQSVVYAISGINIFAKATASSMNKTASSAGKASKSLAGVHNEINNVQSSDGSGGGGSGTVAPDMDLSTVDPATGILESIKNGDWASVGSLVGEKLNGALEKIPWNKIQNTAKKISKSLATGLNGFIKSADWKLIGDSIGEGLNTAIYAGQEFVTTFDYSGLGTGIAQSINGFIETTDWSTLAQTISGHIVGALTGIGAFLQELDWSELAKSLEEFVFNIDFSGMATSLFSAIGSALGGIGAFIGTLINDAFKGITKYFKDSIDECGGNIVEGIFQGIIDALAAVGQWIVDHIFTPFIDGFKKAFDIHSPSKVMVEMGTFIIQGVLDGITSLVNKVKEIWDNMKQTAIEIFTGIKDSISDIWNKVVTTISTVWTNIKDKVKEGARGAWDGVKSIFSNVSGWFKDKFTTAWTAVKDVFSKGGEIFTGIKDGILDGLKTVINGLIDGINAIIKVPFEGINKALKKIKSVQILDYYPFDFLPTITVPQIPKLATGNVAYEETMAVFGEYAGARNNPEITTPQNVMRETFEDVLSSNEWSGNSPVIDLTVNVSNERLGRILLDNLRSMKRQTGQDLEVLVGG